MSDEKNNKNDGMPKELSDLLDISNLPGTSSEHETLPEPFEPEPVESNLEQRFEDFKLDYAKARGSIHLQQQMLMELAKITLDTARCSNTPRLVEAFSQLMSRLSDVNDSMMKHHKAAKEEESKDETQPGTQNNTQNNNYYFTPTEIMNEVGSQYEVEDQRDRDERSSNRNKS